MPRRSGTPMPTAPRNRALPVAAVVAALVGLVAVPVGLQARAMHVIDSEPCARGELVAPDARFDGALDLLDIVARFPGFATAGDRATEVAGQCLRAFHDACDEPRDRAVEQARLAVAAQLGVHDDSAGDVAGGADWREHLDRDAVATLCDGWSDWRTWLDETGLDADAACAVCATTPE